MFSVRTCLAIGAAAVLLTACGSRLDADERAALAGAGAVDESGLTAPTVATGVSGGTAAGPTAPGTATVGATRSPAPAAVGAVAPVGGARPSAPAGGADAPSSGRGFDEDEIRIGYLTWNEVSSAGSAIGYAVDYGDQEAIAN